MDRPRFFSPESFSLNVRRSDQRGPFLDLTLDKFFEVDQGRDCRAAEIQRIVENAARWPDMNT
jgi:hypothetical protein